MKKIILTGAITSLVIGGLMPFNIKRSPEPGQASIVGKISPQEGADMVWLISAPDSIKTNVSYGSFSAMVKPGTYKLIVDGKSPYKDAQLDNLQVKQDQVLDIGEIILEK